MRFLENGLRGATRGRAFCVRQTLVSGIVLGIAIAGCSSDLVTAPPTTSQNVALMARFDSVLGTLDPDTQARRRELYSKAITLLAFGAPVQNVHITVNGTTQSYSGVGGFIVSDDVEGNPTDSAYTLMAWRGDAADTLSQVAVFEQVSTFEITYGTTHVGSIGQANGAVQAQAPHDSCTSYLDHLPPDVSVPNGLTCKLESVTLSASGNTDMPGTFAFPSQVVAGVRVDGHVGG
ncbi:MAG TPA: hypothetical protein VJO52_04400 [Gemmatimonadaceae bacterium]|nr:hypothetical protein [Gemmatimonadaceae bacterium]